MPIIAPLRRNQSLDQEDLEDHNKNVKYSLSRSLSTPKRCHSCHKVVFFKSYKCKHCKHRHHHKKCSAQCHKNSTKSKGHHQGCPKGEEHWTKVLQANEVVCSASPYSRSASSPLPGSAAASGSASHLHGGVGGGGAGHQSVGALSHHVVGDTPVCTGYTTSHLRNANNLSRSSSHHGSCSSYTGASAAPARPLGRESSIFSNLYSRLCKWVGSSRNGDDTSRVPPHYQPHHAVLSRASSGSINSCNSHEHLHHMLSDPGTLQGPNAMRYCIHGYQKHTSMSSEDSDGGSMSGRHSIGRCHSTTSSSSAITAASSSSTATTGGQGDGFCRTSESSLYDPSDMIVMSNRTLTASFNESPQRQWRRLMTVSNGSADTTQSLPVDPPHGGPTAQHLTSTFRSPAALRTPHVSGSFHDRSSPDKSSSHVLTSTWPQRDRISHSLDDNLSLGVSNMDDDDDDDDDDDLDNSVFEDGPHESKDNDVLLRDSLGEFSIPYKDLTFGDKIRSGRRADIYKGRWYGDVMIHTYTNLSQEETACFWRDVSQLAMIRHENVALFMGASLDPPNLAIITSVRKGVSLHRHIHLSRDKLGPQRRMAVIRQVSQGMGYLHAKGIVMTKLNSHNVCLEPKVKLCLMDYGMAQVKYDRKDKACLPQGHLTYIAPEIMRTLRVQCPRLVPQAQYTSHTDVYAFGTLLYELMTSQYPLRHQNAEAIIWQISKGHQEPLTHLKCTSALKHLITRCWSKDPESRPPFGHITRDLESNMTLHKKHSSSEPEIFNRFTSGHYI